MSIPQAVLLGIIQGLTEFLPISSSGHLTLAPFFFGWVLPEDQMFVFGVLVQMGTLLAVIIYFWNDLWRIGHATVASLWRPGAYGGLDARLGVYLIVATIPAGLVGLLFKEQVEIAFSNPILTAVFLFLTAILLAIGEHAGERTEELEDMHWKDALWMGAFQALAIFPGISRSGATITGGMIRQLDRRAAAHFSFLMSVPIMLAAGALAVFDLAELSSLKEFVLPLLVGFLASLVVGYLSIRWLLNYLANHPIYHFSVYLVVVGILGLFV